jgi:predicted RNase H-like nuclease
MKDYIIGIDCATDPRKRGIAIATYNGNVCHMESADTGMGDDELVSVTSRCLGPDNRVLLALDAPLGWPSTMGMVLMQHQAGQGLGRDANDLFRRWTDKFIKKEYGLQSLDVGADHIARTAHSALQLLETLRRRYGHPIPLAMDRNFPGMAAIEVYPAAALKVCDLPFRNYKKRNETKTRQSILNGILKEAIIIPDNVHQTLIESADALDAVVCILSGMDFLIGKARPPQNPLEQEAALKEGWIWLRAK